jgi:esterase/lipase superfamily enzyme
MGSQIALQFLEFTSESRKEIRNIIFVAPDVPRTNFVQGIELSGASARLVTLYATEHDRALRLSEGVNREAPAAGIQRFAKDREHRLAPQRALPGAVELA